MLASLYCLHPKPQCDEAADDGGSGNARGGSGNVGGGFGNVTGGSGNVGGGSGNFDGGSGNVDGGFGNVGGNKGTTKVTLLVPESKVDMLIDSCYKLETKYSLLKEISENLNTNILPAGSKEVELVFEGRFENWRDGFGELRVYLATLLDGPVRIRKVGKGSVIVTLCLTKEEAHLLQSQEHLLAKTFPNLKQVKKILELSLSL